MAVLPETNISTTIVGNAIGNSSGNVGVLCTDTNINVWSRYRPGYFNGTVLTYNAPDGVTIDPRGIDPQTGSNIQGFKLGDFRGYNHAAVIPSTNPPASFNVASNQASLANSRGITFNFGEFDWKNEEFGVNYRGTNSLFIGTYLYLLDNAGTPVVKGSDAFVASILNGNQTITYNFTNPVAGGTTTFYAQFAIGDVTEWKYKIPNLIGVVNLVSFSVTTLLPPNLSEIVFPAPLPTFTPAFTVWQVYGTYSYYLTSLDSVLNWTVADDAPTDGTNTYGIRGTHADSSFTNIQRITADYYLVWTDADAVETTYLAASSKTFRTDGFVNTITLPVGGSPSSVGDGEVVKLSLRNITMVIPV